MSCFEDHHFDKNNNLTFEEPKEKTVCKYLICTKSYENFS